MQVCMNAYKFSLSILNEVNFLKILQCNDLIKVYFKTRKNLKNELNIVNSH